MQSIGYTGNSSWASTYRRCDRKYSNENKCNLSVEINQDGLRIKVLEISKMRGIKVKIHISSDDVIELIHKFQTDLLMSIRE